MWAARPRWRSTISLRNARSLVSTYCRKSVSSSTSSTTSMRDFRVIVAGSTDTVGALHERDDPGVDPEVVDRGTDDRHREFVEIDRPARHAPRGGGEADFDGGAVGTALCRPDRRSGGEVHDRAVMIGA